MNEWLRVFRAETTRLATSKVFWVFCGLMLVCSLIFGLLCEEYRFTDDNGYQSFPTASYLHLKADFKDTAMNLELLKENYEKLRESLFSGGMEYIYTGNIIQEMALYEFVISEAEQVMSYDRYLEGIMENADILTQTSIFSKKGTFWNQNIVKTARDYSVLSDINPSLEESMGIRSVLASPYSDLIFLFSILFLCMYLVTNEKAQELFLRTTRNGRGVRNAAKMTLLALCCLLLHGALFVLQILFAHAYYGLGELSRPIQSVFISAPYGFSVLWTLVLAFLIKLALYLVFAMAFFLTCQKTSNVFSALGLVMALFGCSTVLYVVINPFSEWNALKYVNLLYLINPSDLIISYININLFGYPFRLIKVVIIIIAIALPIIFVSSVLSRYKILVYRNGANKKGTALFGMFRMYTVSMFRHEIWKLLWAQKGTIVLCVLVLLQIWRYGTFKIRLFPDEGEYREAIMMAQQQVEPLEWASLRLDALVQNGAREVEIQAVSRVAERLHYLEGVEGGELIYDTGYRELLGEAQYVNDKLSALLLCLVLLLAVLPIREWEMKNVIHTTVHGRAKLLRIKLIISGFIGMIIFVTVFLPDLLLVMRTFGLSHMDATAMSFPWLAKSGSLSYMLIRMYCIRFLVTCFLSTLIVTIPTRTRLSTLVCLVLFIILPILLSLFSIKFLDYYPLVWILTV